MDDKVVRKYERTPIGYKCDVHYRGRLACSFSVYTYEGPDAQRTAQVHAVNYGGLHPCTYLNELSRFAWRSANFYQKPEPVMDFEDDDVCVLLPELSR